MSEVRIINWLSTKKNSNRNPFRLKATNSATRSAVPWWWVGGGGHGGNRPGHDVGHQRTNTATKHGADTIRVPHASSSNSGVWTWLGQRRSSSGPDPLSQPSSSPAENHYTHMDDSYNPELGEALYAELDRESGNPSYQNTAYSACGEVSAIVMVRFVNSRGNWNVHFVFDRRTRNYKCFPRPQAALTTQTCR